MLLKSRLWNSSSSRSLCGQYLHIHPPRPSFFPSSFPAHVSPLHPPGKPGAERCSSCNMPLQLQLSSCATNSLNSSAINPTGREFSVSSPSIARSSSAAAAAICRRPVHSPTVFSTCRRATFASFAQSAHIAFLSQGSIGAWRGQVGRRNNYNWQERGRGGKLGAQEAMDTAAIVKSASVEPVEAVQSHPVIVSDALVAEDVAVGLIPEALVWASLNGLVVGDRGVENSGKVAGIGLVHAPVSLLPTPFPADAFQYAVELTTLFNDLVDKVSQDAAFLQQTLSRTQKADEFTARLLAIHSKILEEGVRQDIRLGLHRSDYMLDLATGDLLQVELNTISSSFAGLGSAVSKLHKYLVSRCTKHVALESSRVPANPASDGFARALALAWEEYGDRSAAVLMIVQPEERNMYDQQWLSFKLKDLYGVDVLRRTLAEVASEARLSTDGTLYIGEQVVSVVYYRAGYTPKDYPSESEWDARLLLERSAAVKCPTISYHLTGAKKIQQELARPGVLERFLQDGQAITSLRKCFAGLWSLEGDGSETILEEAIRAPDGFVLKPQREGGGNNTYGADVARKLSELKAEGGDGLAAYILMQRIFPAEHISYLVRGGAWSSNKTVSELGIYGAYLRNGDREILNVYAGHLLRTKASDSNEGGVATGFAVLDSPYLV